MYADAYLAQTDGAYSAACGRRVPSRQKPQALSMTSGLLRRTGSRPCSRPSGSPSCALVVGVISLCGAWVGNLCWMYKLYPLLGIFVVLRGVFSVEGGVLSEGFFWMCGE